MSRVWVRKSLMVVKLAKVESHWDLDSLWLAQLRGWNPIKRCSAIDSAMLGSCQGEGSAHAKADSSNLGGPLLFEVRHCLFHFFYCAWPIQVAVQMSCFLFINPHLSMVQVWNQTAVPLRSNFLSMPFNNLTMQGSAQMSLIEW